MSETYYADFLVERPSTQRFWVVRASGGDYVRHFLQDSIIAMGHIDDLNFPDGEVETKTLNELEATLKKKFPERPKSSITSHSNQVRSFCAGIAVDDIVVTVNSQSLIIGRVTSTAFIDTKPVVISDVYGTRHLMDHQLRRTVEWGPEISRKNVPAALEMTLLAHQTVFNLDQYWDSIYHLLYPCFHFEGRLYLSANIRERKALDNYSIFQLFGLLSGIEAAARQFDSLDGPPDAVALEKLDHSQLNLTSKAEFMSPGSIWSTVLMSPTTMVWCVVIYIMLFGGDVKFFKADGIVDKETRRKAWNLVLKLIEQYNFNDVKKKLNVDIPRGKTEALKTASAHKKKTNQKNVATLDDSSTLEKNKD